MRTPYKINGKLARSGVVILSCLLIAFILFPLKIHHSTLFNSGVSVVIAILVLAWIVYSVSGWIAEGGRK